MKIKTAINDQVETIKVTPKIISKINEAIKVSLEFEELTGKQLNITSTVGEVLTCAKYKLELVVNDINKGYDAIDKEGRTIQIKSRRYKGLTKAMTGNLLDRDFKVPFDFAILTLLNNDYTFKEDFRIDASKIEMHFDRINKKRKGDKKDKRKSMSISQFKTLAKVK